MVTSQIILLFLFICAHLSFFLVIYFEHRLRVQIRLSKFWHPWWKCYRDENKTIQTVSMLTRHGGNGCEGSQGFVLLTTISVPDQDRGNNSFPDPIPSPPSLFPAASSVVALHLHAENFVTQYTHIHLTAAPTSITSQTPSHSPGQCAATPTLLCNVFHNFSTSQVNEAPIYAQFILQYTKSQNQPFWHPPIPLPQARTLPQFSWARTQFASPFKHGLRSFKAERSCNSFDPCF